MSVIRLLSRGGIPALFGIALSIVSALPTHALPMLHASGRTIVDSSGNTVPLRGFNLGAWMVMEGWMCPMDNSGLPDEYSVVQKLDSRFGVATEQGTINAYRSSWLQTGDLDNIKNAGYNCVRVPVWWGDFFTLSSFGATSGWRSDAFNWLDWLVNNCASRGIYVIIDMHGVVGGQSTSVDCGQANANQYWSNGGYQGNTAWMWWQIANHYNGNATVAGYDLINEPTGAPNTQAVWTAYNNLYNSIRGIDTGHMIFMEGAFGNWNWSMLPPPSQYGWTNIVYEMHEYQYNGTDAVVQAGSQNQVNDFNNHASWNVPAYIGEFNDFQYSDAWLNAVSLWNANNMSWTMWSYKATHGLNPDSWGWYDPTHWATTPNISTNAQSTITADWGGWTTGAAFARDNNVVPGGGTTLTAGVHTLSPQCAVGSRLDDSAGGTLNGNKIQIWAANGTPAQNWSFSNVGGSNWNAAVNLGPYCIDAGAASQGTQFQIWGCNGTATQKLTATQVGSNYTFKNGINGLCMDVNGGSNANGTKVQSWACNSGSAQLWAVKGSSQ